jgi:molybdate transport system regulatory protein
MSYRRAWEMIACLNALVREPPVAATVGAAAGGGSALTPAGKVVVTRYRAIARSSLAVTRSHMRALEAAHATAM